MAHLSPFEHDIFISYARFDDRPKPGENFRWVSYFEERLNYELARAFGEEGLIKVWRDTHEVGGNANFVQAIPKGVERSAIFLALLSSTYLKRDYCRMELASFHRKAQGEPFKLSIGSLSRIFNIRLQEIPKDDWPKELADMEGFKFHDDQPLSNVLPPGPEFNAQMEALARELVHMIRAFKTAVVEQQQKEAEEKARASRTVFLAHTESRMLDICRRLAGELEEEGIRVVTDIPPPDEAAEHESRVLDELGRVDLSVHLLDDAPGQSVRNDRGKFYSWEQLRLGLGHAKSQLIWMPDAIKVPSVENIGQRGLLEALEKRDLAALAKLGLEAPGGGTLRRDAYSFVSESKDKLTRIIIDKLDEAAQLVEVVAEQEEQNGAKPVALLDTHQKDTDFAYDLGKVLTKSGVEVRIIPEGDDPRSNESHFADALRQANFFFVIFGQVAADWVGERLKTALKIIVDRQRPLSLWGVYLPPLEGAATARSYTPPKLPPGAQVPYCIETPEMLKIFLKALGVIP
ncbi:MAG TPA: toll/interleukin-1 receptor domain-containing protein [Pyrinomonadaceae bacterium]